jgi:dienelactone hydrolase
MRRRVAERGQRAAGMLAGHVDRLFNDNVLRAKRAPKGSPQAYMDSLSEFVERWNEPRWFDDVEGFFGVPVVPDVSRRGVRVGRSSVRGRVTEDLSFQSPHRPHFGEVGQRFAAFEHNRRVHARRILAGTTPARTAVVLVHGYLGGALGAEEWVWPVSGFTRRGVDVVLAVLPFHGKRHDGGLRRPPRWPGPDLTFAIEGFRQVVADLRALVAWLRHAEGYQDVGMMGMSLGGFSTALMATVEPELSFAVPLIPLASVADWSRDAGQLPGDETQRARVYTLLEEAHALISPLRRPLQVPRERCFVAVAERDAITPMTHGVRIAEHFDVPLEVFPGGHILQTGRGQAFRRLHALLDELAADGSAP